MAVEPAVAATPAEAADATAAASPDGAAVIALGDKTECFVDNDLVLLASLHAVGTVQAVKLGAVENQPVFAGPRGEALLLLGATQR